MNVKDYIESGILEAYVAGAVTEQEKQEVECMSKIYPEIKNELHSLEEGIEAFVDDGAVTPPSELKSSVLAGIENVEQEESDVQESTIEEENVREKEEADKGSSNAIYYWRAAALLFGIFFFGLVVLFYTMRSDFNERMAAVQARNDRIANQLESSRDLILQQRSYLEVIQDENVKKVVLASTDESKQRHATIYWNSNDKNVWVNVDPLSQPPSDKQYQLWALQGDKPISLGVIEKSQDIMHKMQSIDEADAFAITLEPLGGRKTPTMEQLKVLGKT